MKPLHPHRSILPLSLVLFTFANLFLNTSKTLAQLPSGVGSPSQSNNASAGTRGSLCGVPIASPFTAITNSDNRILTRAEHPTLIAYLPQAPVEAIALDVLDQQGEMIISNAMFPVSDQGSEMIHLPFPEDSPELKSGETYQWFLTAICQSSGRSDPGTPGLQGWIERVNLDPTQDSLWFDDLVTLLHSQNLP